MPFVFDTLSLYKFKWLHMVTCIYIYNNNDNNDNNNNDYNNDNNNNNNDNNNINNTIIYIYMYMYMYMYIYQYTHGPATRAHWFRSFAGTLQDSRAPCLRASGSSA